MAGLLRVSIATTAGVDVFENLDCAVSWLVTKRWCEVTNGVNAGGQKRCARTPNISGAHVGLRGVATHTLNPSACVLIARDN